MKHMALTRDCARCGERHPAPAVSCESESAVVSGSGAEESDPYIGVVLAPSVELLALIGVGSMGRVYRAAATSPELTMPHVAVKILHRKLIGNELVTQRFHREARVASGLVHPNLVRVLTTGEVPRTEHRPDIGGEPFLMMEHLNGISLRGALAAAGGALTLERALRVALQVCDGVGEAHANGIVHRDVKPENVMLIGNADTEQAKVLDFGVARVTAGDAMPDTKAGTIFGTARYISPEAAQGSAVTPAGDVYAIAVMLYECLAGRCPFEADNAIQLMVQHVSRPAPDVRSWSRARDVPATIASVLERNLSKQPAARAATASELRRALSRAISASGLETAVIHTLAESQS
jgi:serine/threonine-protein kinase